ncbi:MerR family transcriptional regulator [Lacipirellula sp.]|uniref:helix-turn-helix domain-containing protein n=1 Tax=Lacipirellula sp. TaxID=2691419 RepID=UPI003D0EE34D
MADDAHDEPAEADAIAIQRLYTPAMLAELVGVSVAAIRRWERQGTLQPVRVVRRLSHFDFEEVGVARRLAQLLAAGCSLRTVDRRLAEISRLLPDNPRPLADPRVVVEGRRLFLRLGDDLAEPGGQLLLDFDETSLADDDEAPATISIAAGQRSKPSGNGAALQTLIEQLQQEAIDWEDAGRLDRAAESYRTLLLAAGPQPEFHFALADVLYRANDLSAARERYYSALEIDEEYVEARASLGCVLAETGELELAAATLEGALQYSADFADVHYHLAHVLDRLDRPAEALEHWRTFLDLAPESPWAAAARDRLAAAERGN